MQPDTSKLIHFDRVEDLETLNARIENHIEVFGYTFVEYQLCKDLGVTPEFLVDEKLYDIKHGTCGFNLTPKGFNRTFNTGESLAQMSRSELKQAIKDSKTATKTKQRIRN